MTVREDGLIKIRRSYTALIGDQVVVVHDVPMLLDPDNQETYLAPHTAERLYELVGDPTRKTGAVSADVYRWDRDLEVAP
jgi:hypothetical protein